jgi:hypothetical protein
MATIESMKTNLRAKLLTFLCPTPPASSDVPQSQGTLIFGNWGCAMIILFFIVIAVLNAIGHLFS